MIVVSDASPIIGLSAIGALGVLIEAKSKGLVAAVAPLLEALQTEAGFRLSPELYRHVIDACSE